MWWLRFLPYIGAAVAVIALLWVVDSRGYDRGAAKALKTCTTETVPAAQAAVQKVCDDLNAITKDTAHALKTRNDTLTAQYLRLLKREASPKCLPVTGTGGGGNGATGPSVAAGGVGVSTEWLAGAFYAADKQSAVAVTCQDTLRAIYKVNGKESLLPTAQ